MDEYPFPSYYAWVRSCFDIAWWLVLADPAGESRSFAPPRFTPGGTNRTNTEKTTETWITLFDNAHRGALRRYEEGEPMKAGMVAPTNLTLRGTWVATMGSRAFHDFTFASGIPMIVLCRDREEAGRYWAGLSTVPEAERCGWCIDRWSVSWWMILHNIAELIAGTVTRERTLQIGKIDLVSL